MWVVRLWCFRGASEASGYSGQRQPQVTIDHRQSVLILHNRYRQAGGEERSVAEIAELLRSRGHATQLFQRSSRALWSRRGRVRAAIAMLAGGEAPSDVGAAVERNRSEIVHAHNITPLFGPKALKAARDAGARIVLHLHNYRLVCAVAVAYRDGEICTRCHGQNTTPGVRLRCRGNLPEAAVYGAALSIYQPTILEAVDEFVVPSRAAVARLTSLGLPPNRMHVLPNFLGHTQFVDDSNVRDGEYALFAGRLAEEKGADIAIEAARRSGVPLVIAGAGPDSDRLRELARGAPVQFAGRLGSGALADARRRAAFAVVPSRWDEPCPYAVIEAMAAGLPVLVSSLGGLPELATEDAALPPRDAARWGAAMQELWTNGELRQDRGRRALSRAHELFDADRFYSGLVKIYESAAARP
jgi:glycosyltransferase involved in cell wall biosynthesis